MPFYSETSGKRDFSIKRFNYTKIKMYMYVQYCTHIWLRPKTGREWTGCSASKMFLCSWIMCFLIFWVFLVVLVFYQWRQRMWKARIVFINQNLSGNYCNFFTKYLVMNKFVCEQGRLWTTGITVFRSLNITLEIFIFISFFFNIRKVLLWLIQ